MKILDRYVLVTFIKNYLISLFVLLGLYIVLDMVFNFDELSEVQQKAQVMAEVKDFHGTGEQLRGTLTMLHDDTTTVGGNSKSPM